MSELRNRMLQDMQLAGLVEGTRREYLRAVRQLTAYYMLSPDRLVERHRADGRAVEETAQEILRYVGEEHLTGD